MQITDMTKNAPGKLVPTTGDVGAFLTNPLPPTLRWSTALATAQAEADWALGRLDGVGQALPGAHLLIAPFLRREAVLSSQIEGTVASLSDLLEFEVNEGVEQAVPDVREVRNYVTALEYGLEQLRSRPLSLDLLRALHARLTHDVRGGRMAPGEFRKVQNWIGPRGCTLERARYVPPPPGEPLDSAMKALETYVNAHTELPKLVRAALVHYQFEAIHPFVDGNGRIGRLLISLLLARDQLLSQPLLYLSAFFEANRREYYDHLLSVATQGTWEHWIVFFLQGVRDQARDAVDRAGVLLDLRDQFRQTVQRSGAPARLLELVDHLFKSPVVRVADVPNLVDVNRRTALTYVEKLVDLGIMVETTGKRRDRLFSAERIIRAVEGAGAGDE